MSGSGHGMIYSTHNQSNSTEVVLRHLNEGGSSTEVAQVIPACIQLVLCAIALAVIARVRVLRVGQNLYIVNMILSDVLRAIVGLGLFVRALPEYEFGNQHGENACLAVLFLWHWQFCWSMWGTVLIAQSRHSTIRNPLAAGVTTRKAAIKSAITCLIGIVIATPPLFTWARYINKYIVLPNGSFFVRCGRDRSNYANYLSFVLVYLGVSYWLPFVIVI